MVELDAAQVVIGIETIGFVAHRQAVAHLVHRYRGNFHFLAHTITSCLESIAIGTLVAVFVETIAVGYAVSGSGYRLTVDEIESVVTVLPGSAIFKYVAFVVCADMTAESVAVAAIVYRDVHGVEVVVGIAMADDVMCRTSCKIESDSHTVVGCDVIESAVASSVDTDVF